MQCIFSEVGDGEAYSNIVSSILHHCRLNECKFMVPMKVCCANPLLWTLTTAPRHNTQVNNLSAPLPAREQTHCCLCHGETEGERWREKECGRAREERERGTEEERKSESEENSSPVYPQDLMSTNGVSPERGFILSATLVDCPCSELFIGSIWGATDPPPSLSFYICFPNGILSPIYPLWALVKRRALYRE